MGRISVFFFRSFRGEISPLTFESPQTITKFHLFLDILHIFSPQLSNFPPKTTSLEKNPWEENMLWSCLQYWTGNGEQQQTGISPLKLSSEPFSGVFTSPDSCSAIVVAIIIDLFFYFCLFVCFVTICCFW